MHLVRAFVGVASAVVLACAAAARAEDPPAAPPSPLTGTEKTEHFTIRYRPGSRAAASVDRAAAMAERDLARICEQLKLKVSGDYELALYDDVEDLLTTTGTTGNGGFSAGKASHVPWDNDQTRCHELVHIVAAQLLPKTGNETRNLFAAEGLANALLEFVHGVPVHAVAAWYEREGRLPPLSEILDAPDFYAWMREHPGFNAYDVAGSWYRWLLDTHGPAKVVRYYGGTPAKAAFGSDVDALDKAWRKMLAGFALRPETANLLAVRNGGARGDASVKELLADGRGWTQLLPTIGPGGWTKDANGLTGANPTGEWSVLELGLVPYRDCVVRAHVKTPNPAAIQVRLGPKNCAMLVNGTFVYRSGEPAAHAPSPSIGPSRKETDLVLVRRGGVLEVWVDGAKAVSCEASNEQSPVGIGVALGTAVFDDVRVKPLD